MHSFHPSRGRVLFEVLCAFGIVTSCVGAWKQTDASALLLLAAIAGLYGFVHLFDLRRPHTVKAAEPQRIDFAADDDEDAPLADFHADEPEQPPVLTVVAAERFEPAVVESVEEIAVAKPVKARKPRKTPARRKVAEVVGGRDIPVDAEPLAAVEAVEPMVPEDAELVEFESSEDEVSQPRIEPLFEPEPFFRQRRAAFGRRHTLR